ncbi:MAG: hypothetical protein AABX77_01820 [Nanoarchaeota archaeon]
MDKIREAFNRVKEEMNLLHNEIFNIKSQLDNFNLSIENLKIEQKNTGLLLRTWHTTIQTPDQLIPTNQQIDQIDGIYPTHNPTDNYTLKSLKIHNLDTSIRNDGVPTDRQTDQQTDRQTHTTLKNEQILEKNIESSKNFNKNIEFDIKEAAEILESLDTIKKEIRLKFKHLTPQEMLIFSTIYQLEELNSIVTYKLLSDTLNLSESSIRDYTQRIINKGVPIKKQKMNNKQIALSISPELKKIAPLSTIIKLRDL